MDRRTLKNLVVGMLAAAVLAIGLGIDDLRIGVMVGVISAIAVLAVAAWSGRRGRHTPWPRASAQLAADHAVVLWKPGCLYCERLLLRLGNDPRLTWVNV